MPQRLARMALILGLVLSFGAPPSMALADDPPCRQLQPSYIGNSPRVDQLTVDGRRVLVLKPRSYATANRSYPVLYLLHGGLSTPDEWLARLQHETLTNGMDVLVVMPAGGSGGFYTDWRHDPDRVNQWESFHIGRLVPFIDATYRTRAARAHRAVAGLSMGGFGAMRYAARHPHLFAAAGSFSGLLDTNSTGAVRVIEALAPALSPCFEGRVENLDDRWGPRATDEVWWRDSNPTDLAPNLQGVRLFTRVGTGTPCDEQDLVQAAQSDPTALTAEGDSREEAASFRSALDEQRIAHDSATFDCGIHTYRHFGRALEEFLPWLMEQYGAKAPRAFAYRSAASAFAVWGWRFAASPDRAPEFLDVRDVSGNGFRMTGTGPVEVVTAPLFTPGRAMVVTGAGDQPQTLRADRAGRLRLTVDLGSPSDVQEYSAASRTGLGRPRVTRTVRLRPCARCGASSRRRHGA